MPFYNRGQPVAVVPYLAPNQLPSEPLGVDLVGGTFSINVSVPSAGNVAILGAPAIAGTANRLHRLACADIVGNTGAAILLSGSTFLGVLMTSHPTDNLDGQVWTSSATLFNSSTVTLRVTLFYDVIRIPTLQ